MENRDIQKFYVVLGSGDSFNARRQRQVDFYKFEANLVCRRVSSRLDMGS